MAKTGTDRRMRDMDRCPAAKRAARGAVSVLARAEVRAALALTRIQKKRAHVWDEKTCVQEWAVASGYGPNQVRRLLGLGRAFRLARSLVGAVRRLEVCAESAVWIGKLFSEEKLDLDEVRKAEWLERARSMAPLAFKEAAEKAIDDARQGRPTASMQIRVTYETARGFGRVRLILSKGRKKQATDGETLGHLVDYWRLRNDPRVAPLPKKGRKRGGRGRTIPAYEEARVRAECGDLCDICRVARAREFIHVGVPHGKGGGQSREEITQGCYDCHFFVDRGIWVYDGRDPRTGRRLWTYNPDWDRPMRDKAAADEAERRGELDRDHRPDPTTGGAGRSKDDPEGPNGATGGADSVRERPPPYLAHLRLPGRPAPAWA